MALSFENPKEYITEMIGTMILVAIGCFAGISLIAGGWWNGTSTMVVGAAFALTFIGLIYCIGKYCSCHFNPLITLSMFISGKMKADDTLWYVLAQIIGGIIGAVLSFFVLAIAYDTWSIFLYPSFYGGYYENYGIRGVGVIGAMFIEFFLAFILSYVAMKATNSSKIDMKSGSIIAIVTFGLIWILGEFTYSAINPAQSIGSAIAMMFSDIKDHFEPLIQLWLFIIFPALGAVVGTFLYMIMESGEFDLNKYITVKKDKPAADDAEEPAEESDDAEYSEEEAAEEEPAEEEPVADEPVEEIPEIESVEEEPLPEVESEEEVAPEESETKTE